MLIAAILVVAVLRIQRLVSAGWFTQPSEREMKRDANRSFAISTGGGLLHCTIISSSLCSMSRWKGERRKCKEFRPDQFGFCLLLYNIKWKAAEPYKKRRRKKKKKEEEGLAWWELSTNADGEGGDAKWPDWSASIARTCSGIIIVCCCCRDS